MTIQRMSPIVLLLAGLSLVTACGRDAAPDKPAAPPVTFKPVPPGGAPPASGSPAPSSTGSMVGGPGGPAAMVTDMASGWPITLQVGQEVMVRLATNRNGGMGWKQKGSPAELQSPAEPKFENGTEIYLVKAVKPGQAALVFEYRKTAD